MLSAPAPDVDKLISGGRVRQRRRNLARIVVAATAVAVLAAGGLYGVTKINSEASVEPAKPPSTTTPQTYRATGATIEPGTYRMFVGVDTTGVPIDAALTFDGVGWNSDDYPVLHEAASSGAVGVYEPLALAAGNGCFSEKPNTQVGQTAQELAQQLAQLPRSTVIQSPAPVQAFDLSAIHLRLRIDQHCGGGIYRVAMTLRGSHGISYGFARPVVIDFWVMDVGEHPVVVDMWHEADAPSQLVDQITRTRKSITFVTGR